MYRNRLFKFANQDRLVCEPCQYETTKRSNYQRHLESDRHNSKCNLAILGDYLGLTESDSDVNVPVSVAVNVSNDFRGIENADEHDEDRHLPDKGRQGIEAEGGDDFDEATRSIDFDDEVREDNESDTDADEDLNSGDIAGKIHTEQETEWYPFESKVHFLLCTLYSSKTHRLSDEVMSFILYIMRECGCPKVPSMMKIKNFLQRNVGMEEMTQKHEDKDGNVSYIVKPSSILKLQLANPELSRKISRYPCTESSLESNLQSAGERWKEMEFHWAQNKAGIDFVKGCFVTFNLNQEVVYGKILQFLDNLQEDRIYIQVDLFVGQGNHHLLKTIIENDCLVKMGEKVLVPADECNRYCLSDACTFLEFNDGSLVDMSREKIQQLHKVSPLWKGLPVVHVPLNLFLDDMSANQSKRWSPLHSIQCQVSGLATTEKNSGKNVFLLGVSDKMKILDLIQPICQDIQACKQFGIETFDVMTKRKVLLTSDISLIVSDYEMTSLVCNHMGPSAKKYCPKCMADETDPFNKWAERTTEKTKRTLDRLRITRDKTSLQKETGTKLFDNCLWDYINPHRDTPIGILHFLYLGLAKHLLKICLSNLSDPQKDMLSIHLESIDQSSFSHRVNSSFFKYFESRQGKDFKHYLQVAVYNMEFAGLSSVYVSLLKKLALISKHVVQGAPINQLNVEFNDYLISLQQHIPEAGRKKKTHLCVHLADDMTRHGHVLEFSEDAFEKNHKNIRSSIQFQNGHARSRDTAIQMANSMLMSHVVVGGFFPNGDNWRCAADSVQEYGTSKIVSNFLGMPYTTKPTIRLKQLSNKKLNGLELMYAEVHLLQCVLNCGSNPSVLGSEEFLVQEYQKGTMQDGNTAQKGSFVLYMDENDHSMWGVQRLFDRATRLTSKLLTQGYVAPRLLSSLKKFYGNHHVLVNKYGISISQMSTDVGLTKSFVISSFPDLTNTKSIFGNVTVVL